MIHPSNDQKKKKELSPDNGSILNFSFKPCLNSLATCPCCQSEYLNSLGALIKHLSIIPRILKEHTQHTQLDF